jgi:hypothetical protein
MDLVFLQMADRIAFAPPSNIPHGLAHQSAQFGFRRHWIAAVEKLGAGPLDKDCDPLPEKGNPWLLMPHQARALAKVNAQPTDECLPLGLSGAALFSTDGNDVGTLRSLSMFFQLLDNSFRTSGKILHETLEVLVTDVLCDYPQGQDKGGDLKHTEVVKPTAVIIKLARLTPTIS